MAKDGFEKSTYEVVITGSISKKGDIEILYGPETFMAKNERSARYISLLKMAEKIGIKKLLNDLDFTSLTVKARPF